MKIAVIGCTHAGTAAIANAAKLYSDAEITVFERNDNISFLSCGIALYVAGVVKDPQGLFYSSPDALAELGVKTKMKHDVLDVNFEDKILKVKDLESDKIFDETFDKLIITCGSWPIIPKIDGIYSENVLLCKNYFHSKEIIEKSKNAKNIVVVGAGYIGVELVEAFEQQGKNVILIDEQDRILPKYLDKEFTDIAQDTMEKKGIKLALGEKVEKFEKEDEKVKKVITNKSEYDADLVIMCIGFRPNTNLFKDKLNMTSNGAIIVDKYMNTSQTDVFAAGDCCNVIYNPTNEYAYIPLATNAVRMGTLIAHNLREKKYEYLGTQATSGIKIYNHNIGATGLTEKAAKDMGLNVKSVLLQENHRPEFMPDYEKLQLKVVYNEDSKEILGAQIISDADLTQSINTMSVVIQNKMKIHELAFVDFFFQPHYNKPWNYLNSAGLMSL